MNIPDGNFSLNDAFFEDVLNCLVMNKVLNYSDAENLVRDITQTDGDWSPGALFQQLISERSLIPDAILKSIQLGEYLVKTGKVRQDLCIEALSNEIQNGERLALFIQRKNGYSFS